MITRAMTAEWSARARGWKWTLSNEQQRQLQQPAVVCWTPLNLNPNLQTYKSVPTYNKSTALSLSCSVIHKAHRRSELLGEKRARLLNVIRRYYHHLICPRSRGIANHWICLAHQLGQSLNDFLACSYLIRHPKFLLIHSSLIVADFFGACLQVKRPCPVLIWVLAPRSMQTSDSAPVLVSYNFVANLRGFRTDFRWIQDRPSGRGGLLRTPL